MDAELLVARDGSEVVMVNRCCQWTLSWLLLAMACGCKPAEEGRPSLIEEPRILAIQSIPAEAAPGSQVALQILRAGPTGPLESGGVALDFCVARKPIAAPGVVAEQCLALQTNDALVPIEKAEHSVATIPTDACSLFGPKPAPAANDEALRPADPDTTGGYYQPVRALDEERISLFFSRITCGLTGVSQETSIDYARRYQANVNPAIEKLRMARASGDVEELLPELPVALVPGERVAFAVQWTNCPADEQVCGDALCDLEETAANCAQDCSQPPLGCSGAETYLLLDPVSGALRLGRENIRVSWYVTGGELERDKSGRASGEIAHDAQDQFTAPTLGGDYWLFAVIRDDRGGVGWIAQPLHVE